MKIKMLTLAAGPDGINRPGTIIDVRLVARDGDRMIATHTQAKDIAA